MEVTSKYVDRQQIDQKASQTWINNETEKAVLIKRGHEMSRPAAKYETTHIYK